MQFAKSFKDPDFTWENIADIRAMTKLPIILKGI